LELKDTINRMVDQLNGFASEVTRVAREVGQKASSAGRRMSGAWPDLEGPDRQRQPDGVEPDEPGPEHRRGDNGGGQRDLSRKITVEVRGEILRLKETINRMVDQLTGSRRK